MISVIFTNFHSKWQCCSLVEIRFGFRRNWCVRFAVFETSPQHRIYASHLYTCSSKEFVYLFNRFHLDDYLSVIAESLLTARKFYVTPNAYISSHVSV